jgi:hypothetical protein
VFKNARSDKHRAATDRGGHDIVRPKKQDAGNYVPGAARSAYARADFHNFVGERRNSSALPKLGIMPRACLSRPLHVKTKYNFDVYFPKASALKATVKSIVCWRVSIRNTVLSPTSIFFLLPMTWKRSTTVGGKNGTVAI